MAMVSRTKRPNSRTRAAGGGARRPATPALEQGRACLRRGAWTEARDIFARLVDDTPNGEAHDGLASALWWLDDPHASLAHREQAYRAYRTEGATLAAARAAMTLAVDHVDLTNDLPAYGGWMDRAAGLLATLDEGIEHGWFAFWQAHGARVQGNLDQSSAHARRATDIARRLGDEDLLTLTSAADGLRLISQGDLDRGMRLLDAATTAAIAGDLRELAAVGHTCCFLIHACTNVRDYDRALHWSERIASFSERWQVRPLFSTCRTYYAAVLMWRGDWAQAERELEAAMAVAGPRVYMAVAARVRLGELRRRQGRTAEAHACWEPHETHPVTLLGRALMALDAGQRASALALAERAYRRLEPSQSLDRAGALLLMLRVQCLDGRGDAAAGTYGELATLAATVPTAAMRATVRHADALLGVCLGQPARARVAFEDALDLLTAARVPYKAALVRCDYAEALHTAGAPEAAAELARAIEAFERLGAAHDAGRARTLLDAWQGAPSAPKPTVLTRREHDVLRLVAEGLSDRQAALRLGLSEHTIHRHVANILTKLGLPTRTAAVAHAVRERLL